MVIIVKTRVELWKQIWSWPVVAVVVSLLIGGGLTFMTSNHPWLADVFYLAGGILLITKFLTWEVARELDRPKRYKSYVLVIGLSLVVLCTAIWGDHRLSAPGVVQSPSVEHPPESNPKPNDRGKQPTEPQSSLQPSLNKVVPQTETPTGKPMPPANT